MNDLCAYFEVFFFLLLSLLFLSFSLTPQPNIEQAYWRIRQSNSNKWKTQTEIRKVRFQQKTSKWNGIFVCMAKCAKETASKNHRKCFLQLILTFSDLSFVDFDPIQSEVSTRRQFFHSLHSFVHFLFRILTTCRRRRHRRLFIRFVFISFYAETVLPYTIQRCFNLYLIEFYNFLEN